MQRCSRCVNVNTRPRIEFVNGVCNACHYAEMRDKISAEEWLHLEREFKAICGRHKRTNGQYDCIVPCSGGKDSMVVAWNMKYKYGMNPLAVTFAPVNITEAGQKNIEALRKAGIDNITFHLNGKTMAKLCRAMFIRYGDTFIPWIVGIYSFPLQLAKALGISLIVYAESGEAVYGGDATTSDKKLDLTLIQKTARTGDAKDWKHPENWTSFGFTPQDVAPLIVPKDISGIEAVYYAGYHKWGALRNFELAKKIGFRPLKGRMLGSYQGYSSIDDTIDGLYMYLMYLKFGFARCTKDCCKEIREGAMTRKEALKLVKKFDGEFPYKKSKWRALIKYLDITPIEFWQVCTKFINEKVWQRTDGGCWKNAEGGILKLPMWD